MDDVADVKTTAINAAEGAFYNNGQSCCAVERIYVHEKIYDRFIKEFLEEVKRYEIGNPMKEGTFIGHHIMVPKQGIAVHINAFNFPIW